MVRHSCPRLTAATKRTLSLSASGVIPSVSLVSLKKLYILAVKFNCPSLTGRDKTGRSCRSLVYGSDRWAGLVHRNTRCFDTRATCKVLDDECVWVSGGCSSMLSMYVCVYLCAYLHVNFYHVQCLYFANIIPYNPLTLTIDYLNYATVA